MVRANSILGKSLRRSGETTLSELEPLTAALIFQQISVAGSMTASGPEAAAGGICYHLIPE